MSHLFAVLFSIIVTIIVTVIMAIFVVVPGIEDYYKNLPVTTSHQQASETLSKSIENQLNNQTITCQAIQSLRENHITHQNWWEDKLGSHKNWNTARELWNAKNCGNSWGWFD